jgi:hypothetical protein
MGQVLCNHLDGKPANEFTGSNSEPILRSLFLLFPSLRFPWACLFSLFVIS